jgi:regulator of protease activity HflC (stomatin/prohibitin superfamily)
VPFVDKVRANIDLREQVVSFPPQPVITSDNLVVNIDTVIYYSVIDAKSAVYEIANFIQGIEQLTVTTLRNVIGSLDLEQTLTSRDQINGQLRGVLDEATGKWGIRVNRVELKAIDPPHSVQESMEKQMKAERDRRAAILNAEGVKASPRSSPPKVRSRARSCGPRVRRRRGSWRRRARRGPSSRSSTPSTAASRPRSCSPTSTSRSCRSWPG